MFKGLGLSPLQMFSTLKAGLINNVYGREAMCVCGGGGKLLRAIRLLMVTTEILSQSPGLPE